MGMELWIGEMLREQHREWFASLTIADVERAWIASGDESTLTEYLERLANAE